MPSLYEIALLAALIGSGLVAGLCFAFLSFLLRGFDRLGALHAIRTMQAVNAAILRSSAMVVWFGTVGVGLLASLLAEEAAFPVAGTVSYGVGAILITGLRNVPMNEALDRVDPEAPEAAEAWRRYRTRWGWWNALRTFVCALGSLLFAMAL